MSELTQSAKFRQALSEEKPLQIIGVINAYCAMMAERIGYRAIYLSGGGCAAMSYGLPDLGITSLDNVLVDARRITDASSLPLLVDIDTGWGDELNIAHTIRQMIRAGVAAVHIEDQVAAKRCGHRPGKKLVTSAEMIGRIKAAVDAKVRSDFYIIARTDAFAEEGLAAAIDRACAYRDAGADAIFAEALLKLEQYHQFVEAVKIPILANITEFGRTPLFTASELQSVGVSMMLLPWAATRAMNAAACQVMQSVRQQGTQKTVIDRMQDRETLYDFLNYHHYEDKLNKILSET